MKKHIKVFKFGGASIKNPDGIRNVAKILTGFQGEPLVIVVSAMGKTTNALEAVINAYYHKSGEAMELFKEVKKAHYEVVDALFPPNHLIYTTLNDIFVEAEWVLEDEPQDHYDYIYDQVVSIGELASSAIVAAFLFDQGLNTTWKDARDFIKTDETWRESIIQWDETLTKTQESLLPLLKAGGFVLTQGFIGATRDNATTTLGREGSDYSAAILSFCLDAQGMYIWKDVEGVLTADPRIFDNAVKLDRLSYKEAIEMTYYGATVIHPKTIKPLQNKNIPLYVKSFLDPTGTGTVISGEVEDYNYPPMVMIERDQVLLQITTKDFSFLVEHHIKDLFTIFDHYRIFVNMMQNTAISFYACVTNVPDRMAMMINDLSEKFNIIKDEGLELITIRHSMPHVYESVTYGKIILLEERIGKTIQLVVRDVPPIKRK